MRTVLKPRRSSTGSTTRTQMFGGGSGGIMYMASSQTINRRGRRSQLGGDSHERPQRATSVRAAQGGALKRRLSNDEFWAVLHRNSLLPHARSRARHLIWLRQSRPPPFFLALQRERPRRQAVRLLQVAAARSCRPSGRRGKPDGTQLPSAAEAAYAPVSSRSQ